MCTWIEQEPHFTVKDGKAEFVQLAMCIECKTSHYTVHRILTENEYCNFYKISPDSLKK